MENALKAGLKVLGFSDHAPYIFPNGYYSSFRMELRQLEDYVTKVLELRGKYAGQIQIPLGLEIEYYPAQLPKLLPVLRDQPLDYLILGQHFVGNEYDALYNGLASEDEALLKKYVAQTCDAMQTGLFTYFAHPDLINFCGSGKTYQKHMRRICAEAKECGIPLEFNLLGLAGGRHYPNPLFWELAAAEGCGVILGRDAHTPGALLDEATEREALEILKCLGLQPMEMVQLRTIG